MYLLVTALCIRAALAADAPWHLARSGHFEVYAQADDQTARSLLLQFERLRSFFLEQTAFRLDLVQPVRVIAFGSGKEYEPYRLRTTSDAYFAGTDTRNYIVMVAAGGHFGIAAHEYAHLVLHANGTQLPPWLDEGLADFYSTVRTGGSTTELGGNLPARAQTLRRRAWMPITELIAWPADFASRQTREEAEMFYAESWALTDMLLRSPGYASGFEQMKTAIISSHYPLEALTRVYAKSEEEITRDLHTWLETGGLAPIQSAAIQLSSIRVEVSEIPALEARLCIADMLLTAGELDRAEALYRGIESAAPQSPEISGALGTIALRRGDSAAARVAWKRAMDQGVADANLCYRYAILAEQTSGASAEVRAALERAVSLKPDFDDARFRLALLEKNSGDYAGAVANFRAMKNVSSARAFNYWIALADALNELGRRDEAKVAAQAAKEHAITSAERANAAQLAYIADTDLAVQFARDANGRAQMVTTRVPHQAAHWNPFIETGDDLRRVEGTLREIDCSGQITRFVVESGGRRLKLAIPDPARVEMRNAPADFVCGPQPTASVIVEYADLPGGDGLVRGMEFR